MDKTIFKNAWFLLSCLIVASGTTFFVSLYEFSVSIRLNLKKWIDINIQIECCLPTVVCYKLTQVCNTSDIPKVVVC